MGATSAAAVFAVAKNVVKYGEAVVKYIIDDQTATLALLEDVHLPLVGPGVGIGDFTSPDGIFRMVSSGPNRIDFYIKKFPAKGSIWNGPDGIPNDWCVGAAPGSLFHDFICYYRDPIAIAVKKTEKQVWKWASGVLAAVWNFYGGDNTKSQAESWLAWAITRVVYQPYSWLRRQLGGKLALVILSASLFSGCDFKPPDYQVVEEETTAIVWQEGTTVTTNNIPQKAGQ